MTRKTQIAEEMSELMPIFLRNMFPFVFGPIDLPPSQVIALVCIEEQGTCNLTDLKNQMHVSAPTVTGIIDRLERDGYVKRIPDQDDRRVTNVVLLEKGEEIVKQLRNNIKKRWGYILTKLPNEMGESLIQMVRRITEGFKDGTI